MNGTVRCQNANVVVVLDCLERGKSMKINKHRLTGVIEWMSMRDWEYEVEVTHIGNCLVVGKVNDVPFRYFFGEGNKPPFIALLTGDRKKSPAAYSIKEWEKLVRRLAPCRRVHPRAML